MKIKYIIWTFILLLLSTLVSSQPPLTSSFIGDVGLDIEAPALSYFKAGEGWEVYVHVYNRSDGMLMTRATDTVNCTAHIYDTNGSMLLDLIGSAVDDSFLFSYPAGFINDSGIYPWSIHCNNSILGGYLLGYFEVNENGASSESLPIVLALIVLFAFFVMGGIFLFKQNGDKGRTET